MTDWIEGLSAQVQVIAFATLKARPDLGPRVATLWLEKGGLA